MAGPTTGILDNYNRANGSAGANYTTYGSANITIDTNAAKGPGASFWNPTTFGPDVEAYLTIADATGFIELDISVRMASISGSAYDGYICYAFPQTGNATCAINRSDAGTLTQLGATVDDPGVPATGDKFFVEAIGSTITFYRNTGGAWYPILSRTDATYAAAGNIGYQVYEGAARYDDFGGGTVVTGPGPPLLGQPDQVNAGAHSSFGPF
jgi:hypothetical protein